MRRRPFRFYLVLCAVLLCTSFVLESTHAADPSTIDPRILDQIRTQRQSQPSAADDDKGPVTLPGSTSPTAYATQAELQSLGTNWQVTECCGWTGTWTRRPGTNTFDAKWKHTNGTTAQDVITLLSWNKSTGKVALKRHSLNGEYSGTVNTQTRRIAQGTASWYKAGDTWSASY